MALALQLGASCLFSAASSAAQPWAAWSLASDQIKGTAVTDRAGSHPGVIHGSVRLVEDPWPALWLDGQATTVDITNLTAADLPPQQIAIEAWVSVAEVKAWGGIAGCFQEGKTPDQGWTLGYNESHFRFGLAAERRLTWVTSASTFAKGEWYHVAATYDGQTMSLYVNGKLEGSSKEQTGPIVYPAKPFIRLGAHHQPEGWFLSQGMLHEAALYSATLSAEEVQASYARGKARLPQPLVFRVPPHAEFVAPDRAIVAWETEQPGTSMLQGGLGSSGNLRWRSDGPGTSHKVIWSGLEPKARYHYRIRSESATGESFVSDAFELDNALNYSVAEIPADAAPYPADAAAKASRQRAEQVLAASGITRGYCLVLHCGEGQLAYEIAKRSQLIVFGVDEDQARIERGRERLRQAGIYGSRITLHQADSLDALPFPSSFANLLVDDAVGTDRIRGNASQIIPLLQPATGVACIGPFDSGSTTEINQRVTQWLGSVKAKSELAKAGPATWLRVKREMPAQTGSWTHQYADPGNSANSQEGLQGAAATDRLEVQWLGRPGADFGIDRNPRMPAPLAVNGRLFHQGLNRLIVLDSYNGAVLWSKEIPDLRRVNMPRDAGNWCVDPERLFVAVKNRCWVMSAADGERLRTCPLAAPELQRSHEWGYVARAGDLLYGSSVKQGSSYTEFWGGESWYDATSGTGTEKVCSDDLFALSAAGGDLKWRYHDGVIINSTIGIADGKVLFVECRHPEVKALTTGRIGARQLWEDQHLVALNAQTGEKLWDQPVTVAAGGAVFYLVAANQQVFLMSSAKGQYHLYAYGSADGKSLWEVSHAWPRDNHGGHLQHPVVVRQSVFLEPCGYEAASGKLLTKDVGAHGGCATYAATLNALVYRGEAGRISMWDMDRKAVSSWYNLRPSCWLSTVPANGMVLSPEGGGGCSCGNWLETSIGFAPLSISSTR